MSNTMRPRLALVEDNEDLRSELLSELDDLGYPIWGVASAEAFYKQLLSIEADIVLVDLTLPGEDGLELVNYLSEHCAHGIIVVTARSGREARMKGLLKGADHYLVKPVDINELEVAITALWRRLQSKQQRIVLDESTDKASLGWYLDSCGRILRCGESTRLTLSEKESLFIKALLASRNQVVSKEELHIAVFGVHCEREHDVHRIEVIASRVRRKARDHAIEIPLRAVFGRGLVFVNEPETAAT